MKKININNVKLDGEILEGIVTMVKEGRTEVWLTISSSLRDINCRFGGPVEGGNVDKVSAELFPTEAEVEKMAMDNPTELNEFGEMVEVKTNKLAEN